jgi:hypothetical protein
VLVASEIIVARASKHKLATPSSQLSQSKTKSSATYTPMMVAIDGLDAYINFLN